MDLFEFIKNVFNATHHEALPQAPEPAEVLLQALHTNIDYDPIVPRIGGESLSQIYLNQICK